MTPDQIEALELPRKPIEESDAQGTGGVAYNSRITEWEQAHSAGATELNALEQYPDEYRRIVREALQQYTDPDIPTKNRKAADDWEDDVRGRVEQAHREEDVDEDLTDLQQWIDDFNEAYAAVADVFERLRELKGDGSELGEWESLVKETVGDVEYPVASVPDGDAALPEDPIYDSERSYADNKMRIDRYRGG